MPPARSLADEAHRPSTLHRLGPQPSEHDESLDALVECAAELTACPLAALSLVDEQQVWFSAVHGWPASAPRHSPRAGSFCAEVVDHGAALEVADATLDARFQTNDWVVHAPQVRFYAAEPLRLHGVTVGTLCVIDLQARELSPTQRRALHRLAGVATELLSGRERAAQVDAEHERLLDFARASGDWMWETDAALRYTWLSGAFEAVTGLSPEAMTGQLIADSPLLDGMGQALASGLSFHTLMRRQQAITRVITDEATERGALQVSRSAVPVFDAHGQFAGYRGTARDVSAHIAAERRTHGQAELLRKLTAEVPGVIFQFWLQPDRTVSYSYASDAARDLFNVELPGLSDREGSGAVCRAMHPDDTHGFMRSLVDAGAALVPWQREYRVLRPDGSMRWLETRAVPEPHPAGGTLWHGFTSDVSSRKEIELALRSSEARWSMAAAAAGIGIAQIDLARGLVQLDARACADHGLQFPHAELSVHEWMASIPADDRPRVDAALQESIRERGTLETRFRWRRPDGQLPTLELFARCLLDDTGAVVGLVGTCRNVTQQAAHEQLRHDKEAAERASRAKSEFLSRVSHELRTPLNGILGFAQLMAIDEAQPLASDQARRLDNVLRAGRHLLELINDMLNLARIEQQDFSLQPTPVNLTETVQTCFGLVQPLADSAGIALAATPRRAFWAQADGRAVEQVLLNLLSNAIKYNRPHGTVRVSLMRSGARIQLAVSDEGEGLSAAQQEHLFQPFNRLGAEQRRVEGTGLGLVIARELAASMHGELQVQSALGQGSTFSLLLPACRAPTAAAADDDDGGLAQPASPPARRRVLYIEDEPLNVLLMQEVFRARPQWELQIAPDGRAGLAGVQAQRCDLVLVDMNLPDMSGLDLIGHLRADPLTRGLQCIALSADAMQVQIDAALAAGFDGYWTKPINVTQMLAALGQALHVAEA